MTDENRLSDDELGEIFDDVVNQQLPPTDDDGDNADTKPTDDTHTDDIGVILVAIKDADLAELKKLDVKVMPVLEKIAASDDQSQMLIVALSNNPDLHLHPKVRVMSSLAYLRSQLRADGKKVNYRDLNSQVQNFLAGKCKWDDITPHEFVVPGPPTDDLVSAGELAAFLRCTVVDVLALAGVKQGSNKTLVSRKRVTESLQGATKPDDKRPFDYEEPGNGLGDGDAESPAETDPPVATDKPDTSLQNDDPAPVTGYEYITVDPNDPLTDYDDDWFVKACGSLVKLLDS